MPSRWIELQPPLSGIVRSTAYQSQAPYSSYDLLNFWSRDAKQGRTRMATRPGLALITPGPAEAPWRLFEMINVKTNDRRAVWFDTFDYSSMSHYATIPNLASTSLPLLSDGMAYAPASSSTNRSFMIPVTSGGVTNIDATKPFRLGVYIVPHAGDANFSNYVRLYFGMAAGGSANDCFYLERDRIHSSSGTSYSVRRVVGGTTSLVGSFGSTSPTSPAEGWFEVEVHGTTVKAFWRGSQIDMNSGGGMDVTLPVAVNASIPAMGVYLRHSTSGGYTTQIDRVRVQYFKNADHDSLLPVLIASQNGLVYRDRFQGELVQSIATRTLASDRDLIGADFAQKKYIADNGLLKAGADGILTATTFDATGVTDWTVVFSGKNYEDYVVYITSATSFGSYPITAVASGNLTITGGPGSTVNDCVWRIERSPKKYDPKADAEEVLASGTDGVITGTNTFDSATYTDWAVTFLGKTVAATLALYSLEILSGSTVTARYSISAVASGSLTISTATNATGLTFRIVRNDKLVEWRATRGTMPIGCTDVVAHLGRLFLAGDPLDPNEWYATRQLTDDDMMFSDADAGATTASGAAIKGSLGEAFRIRDAIVKMIPYADHYMLFCCRSSIWRMTDDITAGGSIGCITYTTGIATRTSWCYGENAGEVFILTRSEGLKATAINCPDCELAKVSEGKIPRELINIDESTTNVRMEYDLRNKGVHVWLTPVASAESTMPSPTHWFFDLERKAFFRISYSDKGSNPVAAFWYPGVDPEDRCVLIAGYNGDILRYSWTAETDCGLAIADSMLLGPVNLSGSGGQNSGSIERFRVKLGPDSDSVTWKLFVGTTAEDAVEAALADNYFKSGTIPAGSKIFECPKISGGAFVLGLYGAGNKKRVVIESVPIELKSLGIDR